MAQHSHLELRTIRFEGELLPNWAQLLDLASRLCPVPETTNQWFARFTNANGRDDARNVMMHCKLLRTELQAHRERVLVELRREQKDAQPALILGAWLYALDTMIQQATVSPTCSWQIEGLPKADDDDFGQGGEVTLRRV